VCLVLWSGVLRLGGLRFWICCAVSLYIVQERVLGAGVFWKGGRFLELQIRQRAMKSLTNVWLLGRGSSAEVMEAYHLIAWA